MAAIKAYLSEDKVIIWDMDKGKDIFEKYVYGKLREDRLELALIEACLLLEKKKIKILDGEKSVSFEKFYEYCCGIDARFNFRYAVYKDLRKRKLPTRTGFKFGCDFRVYKKGVKPLKRGPKNKGEHTKWIVFAVPEGFSFSFPELSRAVRLAHNIRANMLWAVVGEEKEVKYFQVTFFKP
ncbi:MAG: tRNA-intron lyase [Candidatus Aenigmarchaeota archaeon]|nr:tRNA-intron lyase [Candidatus Aenigmarchaeota archaeon]